MCVAGFRHRGAPTVGEALMEKPVIVRVLMSRDWSDAFRLVWAQTFKAAAFDMGMIAPKVEIVMSDLPSWPERRSACLRQGRRCVEDYDLAELACAWTALAIDPSSPQDDETAPERAKMFVPVNFALGDAIAEKPALLDDLDFARTVTGWRLMEAFGVGGPEQDPVVTGRAVGAARDVDKDELLRWAHKWRDAA
jgi:hypothetical protein